jgi:hypothetical protein
MTKKQLRDAIESILEINKSLIDFAGCDNLYLPESYADLKEAYTWLRKAPFRPLDKAANRFSLTYIRTLRASGETFPEIVLIDNAAKELRKYIRRKPDCLKRRGKKKSQGN